MFTIFQKDFYLFSSSIKIDFFPAGKLVFVNNIYLDPEESYQIKKYTEKGFSWGDNSLESRQLSLAILLKVTTTKKALNHHVSFLNNGVRKFPEKIPFTVTFNKKKLVGAFKNKNLKNNIDSILIITLNKNDYK